MKTRIQHRLRYILEVVRPVPAVVLDILHILTHIARHSSEACSQVNLPLYRSLGMIEKGETLEKGRNFGKGKKDQVKLWHGDQTNVSVLHVFCMSA